MSTATPPCYESRRRLRVSTEGRRAPIGEDHPTMNKPTSPTPQRPIFATLAIFLQVLVVLVALLAFVSLFSQGARRLLVGLRDTFAGSELWIAFVIALAATLGSLFFSEVLRLHPVPAVLVPADRDVPARDHPARRRDPPRPRRPSTTRSPFPIIGLLVGGYHKYIEIHPEAELAGCKIGAPCSTKWINEFGFVTIPVLAISCFAAILVAAAVRAVEQRARRAPRPRRHAERRQERAAAEPDVSPAAARRPRAGRRRAARSRARRAPASRRGRGTSPSAAAAPRADARRSRRRARRRPPPRARRARCACSSPSASASSIPTTRPVKTRSFARRDADQRRQPRRADRHAEPRAGPRELQVVAADAQVAARDELGAGAHAVAHADADDGRRERVERRVELARTPPSARRRPRGRAPRRRRRRRRTRACWWSRARGRAAPDRRPARRARRPARRSSRCRARCAPRAGRGGRSRSRRRGGHAEGRACREVLYDASRHDARARPPPHRPRCCSCCSRPPRWPTRRSPSAARAPTASPTTRSSRTTGFIGHPLLPAVHPLHEPAPVAARQAQGAAQGDQQAAHADRRWQSGW